MKLPLPAAIFYQASPPPEFKGIKKPYKLGGYSDSGADIGFALQQKKAPLITPVNNPDPTKNFDWVFPDTSEGFEKAYQMGARVFWLNTVPYHSHPVSQVNHPDIRLIGQDPSAVEKFDDKFETNNILREAGLPLSQTILISSADDFDKSSLAFPVVLKPIRGRGSQGVVICKDKPSLIKNVNSHLVSKLYGHEFILEEMLPGDEITIAIMPPGHYIIDNKNVHKTTHWALPPVRRFNHIDGVAPYNGVVAVMQNSKAILEAGLTEDLMKAINACMKAGDLTKARAPLRIDCRQDKNGSYKLFDLNMKPNLTGRGRPGREDQDGLVQLGATAIGWDYGDLIINVLNQSWSPYDTL